MILFFRPPALFVSGVSLAFLITYALMVVRQVIWPLDLIDVDHLISTPGAIVGAFFVAWRLKRHAPESIILVLLLGLLGTLGGFMLVDLAFCNTVLYCGPFSLMFYSR
jgi:hypothetical protein